MTAYLGAGGILVPFNCPSAVSIESSRQADYRQTLDKKITVTRSLVSRRSWSVSLSTATPQQIANLQALVEGGRPPWVWVEPYAQVTNLFSPEQSVLADGSWSGDGFSVGGAVMTVDGVFAARSLVNSSGGTVDFGWRGADPDRPPVLPGVMVAFSVSLRGSGSVGISFRGSANEIISEDQIAYNSQRMERVAFNRTPPRGAVTARLWATGVRQVAAPAFSWTEDVPPWSIGRGCNRASIDGLSEDVQLAVRDTPAMRRSSLSFTVREVG